VRPAPFAIRRPRQPEKRRHANEGPSRARALDTLRAIVGAELVFGGPPGHLHSRQEVEHRILLSSDESIQ
jgi:hypothetical protein